ncbi:peptidoglycan-binding protein [Streptomyces sp. NPDC059909]|uniref:peptidoglycan-binding protein n=1 Tax=Streptomyces sp. NPDC059909 TaxID=3346998 RepID=UPI00365E4AC2
MSSPSEERAARPRRRKRPTALAVAALVVLGSCGSVWYIAAQARTPEQRAANAAPPSASQITGEVSGEPLVERLELTGTVATAGRTTVTGSPPAGTSRAVVTALPVKAGDRITAGSPVVEVSGRPVLVLPGRFPAYRDLRMGDKGPDVRQLQQALRDRYRLPVTGTYGPATADAVKRLYAAAGYDAPVGESSTATDPGSGERSADGGAQGADDAARNGAETDGGTGAAATSGASTSSSESSSTRGDSGASPGGTDRTVAGGLLPAAEITYVGSLPATVAEVGGQVGGDADKPLVVLGNGGQHVSAALTADQRTQLRDLPDEAKILFGEGPYEGHSGRLHALRTVAGDQGTGAKNGSGDGSKGEPARQEALFKPQGGPSAVRSGTSQRVTVELRRSPADALSVPVSAVWTDLGGSSVVTVIRAKKKLEVPVEVVFTFDGLAAVRPEGDGLRSGDKVLLSRNGGEGAGSTDGADG